MPITPFRFKILISIFVFIVGFALVTPDNSYVFAQGTGGTITFAGGYTIHTFTSSGTFNPGPSITSVEYLVVAGGGAGGWVTGCCNGPHYGGGGGAGGMLTGTIGVSNTNYPVTVGAGGSTPIASNMNGNNGGDSVFNGITAIGGGGGSGADDTPGVGGGSGGGGFDANGGQLGGPGIGGQGNNGGIGGGYVNIRYAGGGGGGAGGVGGTGDRDFVPYGAGGNGGSGRASSISGSSVMYAGGGGGAAGDNWNYGVQGVGGAGGGGNAPGGAGVNGLGGGGGGNYGGPGGSGIVIIRYPTPVPVINNVTISSSTIIPDNSTQYNIVVTGTNSDGGANITHEYALINYQGANAPNYRGYLTMYYPSNAWSGYQDNRACTGGGWAAVQPGYGNTYIHLDACSVSTSGNTRTTTFTVRFDPSFTTPISNNDISGLVQNVYSINSGWSNFDNFAVYTGPTVSITAPAASSNLRGTSVAVSATASGLPALAGVQFLLDGANLGAEDTASPYSITWDTTTATDGNHSLTARARDTGAGGGLTTTSTGVNVIVDNTLPTASITAPSAGTLSPGTVIVSAAAADSGGSGLVSVQFQVDGSNLGAADTSSPYDISWNTAGYSNANHSLTALATDGAGNTRTSSAVVVRVNNPAGACTINAGDSIKINWTAKYSRNCSVYEDLNSNGVYNAGTDTLIWSGTSNNRIYGDSNGPLYSSKTYKIDCTGAGSTLTKTSGTNAWDSGASSVQSVASGDVYTEFSTNENNTYKMGGLGVGDSNQSYTDIDYAIYPAADANIYIYENGTYVGNFGSYVAGDIFRVAVESGVVKYYKNGAWLYTSGVAPTYPLRFDSSLYTPNATITDVSLTSSPATGVDWQNVLPAGAVNANSGTGQTTSSANTLLVTVTAPPPPTVSTTTVMVTNSNYCGSGVHATVSATVTSSDASDLAAYEVQIDDDSDPLTGNPEWESGTVTGSFPSGSTISRFVQNCTPANIDATPQTACQMNWNTVYRAWVRVRDRFNQWSSPWTLMSTYCNGTSCSPPLAWPNGIPNSWTTPVHAFPQTGFTILPASPAVNSPVTFTDTTGFQGAATPRSWLWNFNYPLGPTQTITAPPSANGNTIYTYTAVGTYTPRLTATDDLGQSCYYDLAPPINIQQTLPQWREVAPR